MGVSEEASSNIETIARIMREPLPPARLKRLQQCFEHASKQMSQENHDYAAELFGQCVLGDPSNVIYVRSYIENLQKKYNHNKTGSKLAQFKERGARSAIKKALGQEQWDEVIKNGLKVLAINPWDVSVLTAMATAAENSGDDEPEMYYLKCALQSNPKDPDVNRQCAMALAARQQFDQAIACWHRVEQARPDDEEVQRAIASLAVEKTIKKGGYDEGDGETKTAPAAGRGSAQSQQPQRELTMEEKLQQKIRSNPQELDTYYELAQLYINSEDYKRAEEVFAKATEVSDGDPDVRERWDDAQLRHLRQRIVKAPDAQTRDQLRQEYFQKQLEVHQSRCQRYPNNLAFRYELGVSYQLNHQYNEAIREFQQARNDPRRRGLCMLALGQCFEQIKQHRLAMSHYESAIEEIPDRDAKNKKLALYQSGKLAMNLKDYDTAEKHFTTLAGLDFSFKDVPELLDKLGQLRDTT